MFALRLEDDSDFVGKDLLVLSRALSLERRKRPVVPTPVLGAN